MAVAQGNHSQVRFGLCFQIWEMIKHGPPNYSIQVMEMGSIYFLTVPELISIAFNLRAVCVRSAVERSVPRFIPKKEWVHLVNPRVFTMSSLPPGELLKTVCHSVGRGPLWR